MRRTALIGLWVAATAATTAMTYWVVNAAGSTVNDRPLSVVVAGGSTSAASNTTNDQSTIPPDTISAPTTSSSGLGSTTTSATNPVSTGSTSPTTATSPSTTTAVVDWQTKTVNSAGGSVLISYRAGEVRMESVVPLAGFSFEIKDDGPDEVRVEFSGGEIESEIRVRWENGALVTEVDDNS